MVDNYNEKDLVKGINENISFVKNIPIEDAVKCVGSIRSAFEYAVKLFWLKKYNKKPVWVKGDTECFDLHKALTDERFSQYFSKMTLSYMHIIRQTCNGVLHDNDPLTFDEAKDLLIMLEKCIKAIGEAIPMEILAAPVIVITTENIGTELPKSIGNPKGDDSETKVLETPEKINKKGKDGMKSPKILIDDDSLQRDLTKGYGGSAQPIYDECCSKFGWDNSRRYLFGRQQYLYAENATPEEYSPWFLAHSNWTQTKGGEWSNKILRDTIEEVWLKPDNAMYDDQTIRVTFAKTKSYGYVFIGVYRPINLEGKVLSDGSRVFIKTYQRISDVYPNFQ